MSAPRRSQRLDGAENSPQPQGTPENNPTSSSTMVTPASSRKRKNDTDVEASTKRPKNTPSQPAYTKHPRFWALDGNTLVQIDSIRFKLHWSRLASQSPWFEKLFERRFGNEKMGANSEENSDDDVADINDVRIEEADGVDLYYLDCTGVTVHDFQTLLTAMDDSIDYYFEAPDFPTVAAIFRVASLFQFQKMLDFARQYLNTDFSSDLSMVGEEVLSHAAEAVLLGREWNLDTVLKRAFYELARRNSLRSTVDSDNESSNGDEEDHDEDKDPIHRLDPRDLIRLANGQKGLMSAWLSAVSLGTIKCVQKTPCNSNRARLTWDVISPHLVRYQFDPICGIQKLVRLDWKKKGYCNECADSRVLSLAVQREEIWESMSVWFDLE